MSNKINELKEKFKKEMDSYAQEVRDHVEEYGPAPCDYLIHRQNMCNYYRGAYNAMVESEKIKDQENE